MIDWYYRTILRPQLFARTAHDPEKAHEQVLKKLQQLERHRWLCRLLQKWNKRSFPQMPVRAMGLTFPNPIGLAPGMDKNCLVPHALAALGFGWMELGGVVPKPQAGNPRPRMWRYPERRELVNAMGFPSDGAAAVRRRCQRACPFPVPTGCNLGKNKDTPLDKTVCDMRQTMLQLYRYFDWFTINVSSPNTMRLRELQAIKFLGPLVRELVSFSSQLAVSRGVRRARPIVVKLSPDTSNDLLVDSIEVSLAEGAAGIDLGNTQGVTTGRGGRSGPSLYPRTLEMIRLAAPMMGGRGTLRACGGIDSPDKVAELLDAGADLVSILTTLIFDGPGQVSRMVRGLSEHVLVSRTAANLPELVGCS